MIGVEVSKDFCLAAEVLFLPPNQAVRRGLMNLGVSPEFERRFAIPVTAFLLLASSAPRLFNTAQEAKS